MVSFAIKYALDAMVCWFGFGVLWTPDRYLQPSGFYGIWSIPAHQWPMYATLLFMAVPFILVGVVLTARRLSDAKLPVWLTVLFFAPFANLLFFLLLSMVPSKSDPPQLEPVPIAPPDHELADVLEKLRHEDAAGVPINTGRTRPASRNGNLKLVIITSLAGFCLVLFGTLVIHSYGWGVFIGIPFLMGLMCGSVTNGEAPHEVGRAIKNATYALLLLGIGLILVAAEGVICLAMAFPLAWLTMVLGVLLGFAVVPRRSLPSSGGAMCLAIVAGMATEGQVTTAPVREVMSSIHVSAPPQQVWPCVVAFPSLASPQEILFRAGIAYPTHAEIEGTGVGAIRRCVFSTGTFVEPITHWEAPRRLAFDVTEQPEPMKELSPFRDLDTPHLEGFLQSHRGEFRLVALADGSTRLEGSTWYSNRMWPQPYWSWWSDHIIHRIHMRVLHHIKTVVESKSSADASFSPSLILFE